MVDFVAYHSGNVRHHIEWRLCGRVKWYILVVSDATLH